MNIPLGATMLVGAYYNPTGEWTIVQTYFNASTVSFYYNQTYTFAFSVWVGLEFNFFPGNLGFWWLNGDFELTVDISSVPNYQYIDAFWDVYEYYICSPTCHLTIENEVFYESSLSYSYQDCLGSLCNWTTPWYFPLGAVITLSIEDYEFGGLPAVYVTGTGVGSFTGQIGETLVCGDYFNGYCYYYYYVLGAGPISTNGPIQETIWLGDAPENLSSNVTFSSAGLPWARRSTPPSTGPYLSGTPAAPAVVNDVAAGAYSVSDVWATSSTPGWECFGAAEGPNPFVPPLDTSVTLAFDAFVNVAAPAGPVSFHAPAIGAGTTWSLTFNGTTYTSHTPWINLTTRPGTFAYSVGDAVAPSGTAGYVPTTPSGNESHRAGLDLHDRLHARLRSAGRRLRGRSRQREPRLSAVFGEAVLGGRDRAVVDRDRVVGLLVRRLDRDGRGRLQRHLSLDLRDRLGPDRGDRELPAAPRRSLQPHVRGERCPLGDLVDGQPGRDRVFVRRYPA